MAINIAMKPVEIHLKQVKDRVIITTPHASMECLLSELYFFARGIAYEIIPYKLKGDPNLCKRFQAEINQYYCLSHLAQPLSPFVRNYFINKLNPDLDLVDNESMWLELAKADRVVFCGAGPSLSKSLDFLRFCKDTGYALIVAGGSGIKSLEKFGIVPDLCIACDPNQTAAERGAVSQVFASQTVLFASSGTNVQLVGNWPGPVCLGHGSSALPIGSFLEPGKEVITEGGIGVSSFIFNICEKIQAKELYLCGVDLCAADNGQVYGDDIPFTDEINADRETIWKHEAAWLNAAAVRSSFKTFNLSKNGRDLKHIPKIQPPTERVNKKHGFSVQNIRKRTHNDDFLGKLVTFHTLLTQIDYLDAANTPLFPCLIEPLHQIYTARQVFTGEYPKDSLMLRLEYLKALIEQLFPVTQDD